MKNKKIDLFEIYLFLSTFNIINREFVPFIDIRFLIAILAVILIFIKLRNLINNREALPQNKNIKLIILFYILIAVSNVSFITNGLLIDKLKFVNLGILNLYNFVNIITIYLYSEKLQFHQFLKYFKISFIILGISMIISWIFGELPFSDYSGIALGTEHINLIGQKFRLGGYLVDPNYVTIVSLVFIVLLINNNEESKYSKRAYLILALLYIAISFSKTVLLVLPFIIIVNYIISKIRNEKIQKILYLVLIMSIFLLPIVILKLGLFDNMQTMNIRYEMWNSGFELFSKSPLLGNGLGSCRSYLSVSNNWYVQIHSTIIQILAEHGIFALIVFGLIFYNIIIKSNKRLKCIYLIYLTWTITYETEYLNFMILFLAILPNLYELRKVDNQNILKEGNLYEKERNNISN